MIEGCLPEGEGDLSRSRLFSLGLGFFLLMNLSKVRFLQEAFLDWLYPALITSAGLSILFWCFIHQVFMKA